MKSFLDKHNKIILKKHTNRLNNDDEKLCNCLQRVNCPTDGNCLTTSVFYKAEVTSTEDNTTQTYIGVTANDFKTRYRNHLKSLRNEKYKHETQLSKQLTFALCVYLYIYIYIYICKQVGELLKSWVNGCLIQSCFVGHRKGNPLPVKHHLMMFN